MYDERLVKAAQEGDEAAFAALYDRAADSVFDFCWWLTGDADEAARLVEEAFVLAARNLDELSDPSQVRPWLLAIAADRAVADDEEGVLKSGWGTPGQGTGDDEPLGTAALRQWTAGAAAVLALPDQIVLELQLRQDLEGDQLAATIGTTPAQLAALLARVDEEAETVLGSLVLARQGRRDCPELAALLADWDGAPFVEIADLVHDHAEECVRCSRRRNVAEPLELVAAAPVETAPGPLRNRVLDLVAPELAALAANRRARPRGTPAAAVAGPPTQAIRATGAAMGAAMGAATGAAAGAATTATTRTTTRTTTRPGDPAEPGRGPGRYIPLGAIVGGIAAVLLLVGAVILFFHDSGGGGTKLTTSTTLALAPIGPSPTLAPIDTTTTPTTAGPASALALNTSRVDLGSTASTAQVLLSAAKTAPANWSANTGVNWLAVSPSSGSLGAGQSVRITLSLTRAAAPAGAFSAHVVFAGSDVGGVPAAVDVVGQNTPATTTTSSTTAPNPGPSITAVSASPSTVYAAPCPLHQTSATVSATVTDPSGAPTVELLYTLPGQGQASEPMTQAGQGQWTATLPSSSSTGAINYEVRATDGSLSKSQFGAVTVAACPGVR